MQVKVAMPMMTTTTTTIMTTLVGGSSRIRTTRTKRRAETATATATATATVTATAATTPRLHLALVVLVLVASTISCQGWVPTGQVQRKWQRWQGGQGHGHGHGHGHEHSSSYFRSLYSTCTNDINGRYSRYSRSCSQSKSRSRIILNVKERRREDVDLSTTSTDNNLNTQQEQIADVVKGDGVKYNAISTAEGAGAGAGAGTTTTVQEFLKEKVFLGISPSPEILAIMAIYFVEGALGLARLAQTFYLKDTLHLGPAELSALTGLFTLPWTIKPLYGFLSDGLPLFGYRRRSYLILCGLLGAASYTALGSNFGGVFDVVDAVDAVDAVGVGGNPISVIQATIASFVISSGCIAFSDVVADGIVVQRTRDSDDPKVAGKSIKSNFI